MGKSFRTFLSLLQIAGIGSLMNLAVVDAAAAQDLPAATRAILTKLKLDPSILQNIDKELAVPGAWLEAAKKEATVEVYGAIEDNEFAEIVAPFHERYPFITMKYSNPPRADRIIKPVIGAQTNRNMADFIFGLEEGLAVYTKNDILEDLADIPGLANVPDGFKDPGHKWVATKLRYGCIAYNTQKIAEKDLPRTWEALLEAPQLRKGNLALVNRPNQWLASLWTVKGDAWGTEYVRKLFDEVRPQLRKENTNAMTNLLAAGEFTMQLPGSDLRVALIKEQGAPVEFYCPTPAPAFLQLSGIVKGSPRPHATKLFLNWFLSKEGQLSHYMTNLAVPIHKDLQARTEFLPAGVSSIADHNTALHGPTRMDVLEKMYDAWRKATEQRATNRK